ncbi:MAG: lasso peptide biosynthesis protein [Candidatus Eremiobacteraeota bacterium]|nr:lasso peptide biosynthesis protein [Candidatus Eremiobacteraeota bacterium]
MADTHPLEDLLEQLTRRLNRVRLLRLSTRCLCARRCIATTASLRARGCAVRYIMRLRFVERKFFIHAIVAIDGAGGCGANSSRSDSVSISQAFPVPRSRLP